MNENKELKITPPEGYEIDKKNSTLEHIKFKKKEIKLPDTWEEAIKGKTGYYIESSASIMLATKCDPIPSNRNICLLESTAEELLALTQVLFLRDVYRQGWVPDWEDDNQKYHIRYGGNDVVKERGIHITWSLSFQTQEIRDLFFDNFKDLIEKCKNLI